jgi:hypothetical protein
MTPRGLLTTIGATALGFGLVIGAAPVIPDVFAQEATPPAAEAPAQAAQGQEIDFEAQRAQAYDSFITALASELGSDKAAVDAAIRKALTQQVDERAAAGDIGAEQAAAMKAVIEVSQAPLFLGFGGHGMHGFEGHDDRQGPGGRGGDDDRDQDGDQPGDDESTTSLPSANDASNQSAPAPVTPAQSVAIS